MDASGGTGSVTVTAQQECAWSAASDVSWITFPSSTSGQGNGNVDFRVAANPNPAVRHGTITVNGKTVTIDQAAASCAFNLATSSQTVAAAGGPGTVGLSAGPGCAWTAVSNADWISITSGASGIGDGTVGFTVAANSGASRTGTLTIAGQTFTVTQSPAQVNCTFTLGSASQTVAASGGSVTVTVSTAATCRWTATSNAPWVTINSGASGTGNGSVSFTVGPNSGAQRTGTLTIATQTFTVTQASPSSGCSYTVTPMSQSFSSAASSAGPVTVQAPLECAWTAASNTPWITGVRGGGSGPGQVFFSVAANNDPAFVLTPSSLTVSKGASTGNRVTLTMAGNRQGTLTIAGKTFSASQANACMLNCPWTATPDPLAPWLILTGPLSGTGNGMVTFSVLLNPGAERHATLHIAGLSYVVTQQAGP